jgi:hypothetical protein
MNVPGAHVLHGTHTPLESKKPGLHRRPQVLPLQVAVAFAAVEQG